MTNITLSIENSIHKRMREHSEIKWSEFVRKQIKKQLDELDSIKSDKESIFTMLASQEILKKDWENKYDDQWDNV